MTQTVVSNDLLLSELARLFAESDIRQIDRSLYESWPSHAMAFEDEYAVIAVWPFDSVDALVNGWGAAQDHVVRLLGTSVVNTDPKSWDGYLVLAAVDGVPEGLAAELSNIRSDTRRVRKLVVTADDLPSRVSDPLEVTPHIRRALAPILDLDVNSGLGRSDPLDSLPTRLSASLVAAEHLLAVVAAYEAGGSLLDELHDELTKLRETEAG
ncbi:hypothetical protein ABH924_001787 [Arthrobacter sp. GAS37]|uniref:hypothetical protein n=1 Tax=Arthrobacter sp. GAS37 TaxID=3156261 RepID=UPI003835B707